MASAQIQRSPQRAQSGDAPQCRCCSCSGPRAAPCHETDANHIVNRVLMRRDPCSDPAEVPGEPARLRAHILAGKSKPARAQETIEATG
eukprot:515127-Prymnesium_polylepis.1